MVACSAVTDLLPGDSPTDTPQVLPSVVVEDTPIPSEAVEPTAETGEQPADDAASEPSIYVLSSSESQARFRIWEVLFGANNEVVGVTNAVDGSISVDLNNPQGVTMSVITVNMTGLATDNNSRNGQIHRNILETGVYSTATFEPSEYIGVPESVAVGDTFNFQLAGNLTIHGTTAPATFDVSVTVESEDRISGLATLVIEIEDYGVQLLFLPSQVASVAPETTLELQFVAVRE
jgi:polyisoprenoid-binding protein YceI